MRRRTLLRAGLAAVALAAALGVARLALDGTPDPSTLREERIHRYDAADGARPGAAPEGRGGSSPPEPEEARRTTGEGTEGGEGPPVRRVVRGLALGPGDAPLAGVRFLDVELREGNRWDLFVTPGPTDEVESGDDGSFSLPWIREQESPAFLVLFDHGTLDRVEGGARIAADDLGDIVRVAEPDAPLVLRFADAPGSLLLKALDADTGAPVALFGKGEDENTRLWFEFRTESETGVLGQGGPHGGAGGGWTRLPAPRRRDDEGFGISAMVLMRAGYEPARLDHGPWEGRRTLTLRPSLHRVRGTLRLPEGAGEEDADAFVPELRSLRRPPSEGLRHQHPAMVAEPRGVPERTGPFEIRDLGPGPWLLEVTTMAGDRPYAAVRRFDRGEGVTDLGTVHLVPASTVTVRVTDGADRPAARMRVLLLRPWPGEGDPSDGSAGSRFHVAYAATDDAGEVVFTGLLPSTDYAVTVAGETDGGVAFRTGATGGESHGLHLRWPGRMVRCRFRLRVPDVEDPRIAPVMDATDVRILVVDAEGVLEGEFPSGRFRLEAMAGPKAERSMRFYRASIEIPAQDEPFEADLELK